MENMLRVKKWGGENAAEFIDSPANVLKDYRAGIKQAVVVSAIRSSNFKNKDFNTTDKLIKIGEMLKEKTPVLNNIMDIIIEIKDFHLETVEDKIKNIDTQRNLKILIEKKFNELMEDIILYVGDATKLIEPSKQNDYLIVTRYGKTSILGFGEELSALVQTELINNLGQDGLKAQTVDLEGVFDDLEAGDIYKELSDRISSRVDEILREDMVAVVPGYIPGSEEGIEKMVGRGYSDATAAMTAVGLSKGGAEVTLEIQKSVEGMLSADPRLLRNTKSKLIEEIDYITAKEITGIRGAQAKLLHSQVLRRQLQEAGIKVHLFNPFEDTKGTIISTEKSEKSSGVEFIGARNNIIFFSISSGHMEDLGILAGIFDIVKDYKPVDIVSTSETEISFTIDNEVEDSILDEMKEKIRKKLGFEENDTRNKIEYVRNKALVYCIGQNLSHAIGSLGRAAGCLHQGGINIELVSQGAKERAMVFGIEGSQMKEAVNLLHKEFID